MTDIIPRRCQIWILSPLDCGHEDDDPAVWHYDADGRVVCARCCSTCNEGHS